MSEAEGNTSYDPFGEDVAQAQLIVSLKIYDVLMALLTIEAPGVANKLDELHTKGVILGHGPTFVAFADRTSDDEITQSVDASRDEDLPPNS